MRFEFATANRIVFGPGTAKEVVPAAREMGTRALLVTGADASRAAFITSAIPCVPFAVEGEPTVDLVQRGAELLRESGCDLVIAVGGGSVIDGAKAIASIAANPGEVLDYLEVVGRGKPITRPSHPFIAVPTTAGTGSEVTRNAVLGSPEYAVKASLRSPYLLPRMAVVDPELTLPLPPSLTASTGLDALTQLIEPYVSARRNALTDLYCIDGMRRAARSLETAFNDGSRLDARLDMSFASLLGGLSLANAGLGVVHGFAAPIGGMFHAPHGAVCAALLPHGMRVNIRALRERGDHDVLDRYREVAVILTGNSSASPNDGAEWVAQLCSRLEVPGLRAYGLDEAALPGVVEKAMQASSTKGNPIVLKQPEMLDVIASAL